MRQTLVVLELDFFNKTREDGRKKMRNKLEISSESTSKQDIDKIEEECCGF